MDNKTTQNAQRNSCQLEDLAGSYWDLKDAFILKRHQGVDSFERLKFELELGDIMNGIERQLFTDENQNFHLDHAFEDYQEWLSKNMEYPYINPLID